MVAERRARARRRAWTGLLLGVVAAGGLFAASAPAATEHATPSKQISFYGDLGNPINSPYIKNPLLVRPSRIFLFEDGSWVLEKLHWSAWGSSVARARGISSASNCTPNCAAGKRTNVPAQFTLSSPGRVLGHRVYRCYQLTIPSRPQSDQHACLKLSGKMIVYSRVAKTSTAAPVRTSAQFDASSGVHCEMNDPNVNGFYVFCNANARESVGLGPSGVPTGTCHGTTAHPCIGNPEGPTLAYGKQITVGRFRCRSQRSGVICTVIKSGKGFFINSSKVTAVGP